jgi:3-phosphoshikimate 1-carboxyvinyltransferase
MDTTLRLSRAPRLRGAIAVPGDKSISHRALLFGALATGETRIRGLLMSEDVHATLGCLRAMGVCVDMGSSPSPRGEGAGGEGEVRVLGVGPYGLQAPTGDLWVGNSGTTTRLLMGILAGQPFAATLAGDASLNRRPMDRVAIPLRLMGADVEGQGARITPPVTVRGRGLHGIAYTTPVASAQVKSAILLAGLYAEGETAVTEPSKSRDHTERMLRGFGARVAVDGLTVRLSVPQTLRGQEVTVPGDISSAAFFLVAGALVPGAEVTVRGVGINPTRAGVLDVLRAMGADLTVDNRREAGGEPVADLTIRHSPLHGTEIAGDLIPRLIDELPVLAVAAACAEGETIIRDARELRVKESDRVETVCRFLAAMGADIEAREDGMVIRGARALHGAPVSADGDHRIAMSAAVAALVADGETTITGADTIATSFPGFTDLLQGLTRDA